MKKFGKIIPKLLIVVLLLVLFWIANEVYGNPFIKQRAIETAQAHLAQNYPEHTFDIVDVGRTKSNSYIISVASQNSVDTHFEIDVDDNGSFLYDTYTDHVLSGSNTYLRYSEKYNQLVQAAFESADFNYPNKPSARFDSMYMDDISYLQVDGQYDVLELAEQYGELYYSDELCSLNSYEEAAECLLKMKLVMDNANLPFSHATLMQATKAGLEDGAYLRIYDFPATEIQSENLVERIKAHAEGVLTYEK